MSRFAILFLKLLGVLLIAAAVLKTHGWAVDPVRPTGWFALPAVQAAVVFAEIALGLWFLSGYALAAAWLSALSLFTLFSIVSFRQGWVGEASCGCFGSLAVNPWLAFGLDVVAIALLGFARPQKNELYPAVISIRSWIPAVVVALLVVSVAMGWAIWSHGSAANALAHLRGEMLTVQPSIVDLGDAAAGEPKTPIVTIINHSIEEVHIFGGTSDCGCTVLGDLPQRIPAGASKSISIQVRMPQQLGRFTRTAKLITDADGSRAVQFRITGRSIEGETVAKNR